MLSGSVAVPGKGEKDKFVGREEKTLKKKNGDLVAQ